ncbi:MAG: lysoplasmalogenase [Dermatophilaceae bacterium]
MTTNVWVLSVALGVTALLNWGSVARGDRMIERITKPSFMVLLIGLAWSLHGEGRVSGAPTLPPVMLALGLSLIGDVALLHSTARRFLLGLTAFLLAHIAWIWAVVQMQGPGGFPWWLLPAVPVLLVLHGRFGRHIVRHAGRHRVPVFLYQLVLVALVLVAAWRGDWVVLLGCFVFLVSDTILGHDRFVLERRWAPLQVMVTYHVAQVLIVIGLLR